MAVTACVLSDKTFADYVVRFSTVKFQIGINNIDTFKSSGKFVCEIPGLYFISVHIRTRTTSTAFYVRKNSVTIATSMSDSGNDHSTNPISAVVELQLKDTLYISSQHFIYSSYSCLSIVKVSV